MFLLDIRSFSAARLVCRRGVVAGRNTGASRGGTVHLDILAEGIPLSLCPSEIPGCPRLSVVRHCVLDNA